MATSPDRIALRTREHLWSWVPGSVEWGSRVSGEGERKYWEGSGWGPGGRCGRGWRGWRRPGRWGGGQRERMLKPGIRSTFEDYLPSQNHILKTLEHWVWIKKHKFVQTRVQWLLHASLNGHCIFVGHYWGINGAMVQRLIPHSEEKNYIIIHIFPHGATDTQKDAGG